jgi:hypothetical protein
MRDRKDRGYTFMGTHDGIVVTYEIRVFFEGVQKEVF